MDSDVSSFKKQLDEKIKLGKEKGRLEGDKIVVTLINRFKKFGNNYDYKYDFYDMGISDNAKFYLKTEYGITVLFGSEKNKFLDIHLTEENKLYHIHNFNPYDKKYVIIFEENTKIWLMIKDVVFNVHISNIKEIVLSAAENCKNNFEHYTATKYPKFLHELIHPYGINIKYIEYEIIEYGRNIHTALRYLYKISY